MTSTIKKIVHVGTGSATGETGKSTIQFPKKSNIGYLILCGGEAYAVCIRSETAMIIHQLANAGNEPVVTANGDYNFTLSGLPWYSAVHYIGIL